MVNMPPIIISPEQPVTGLLLISMFKDHGRAINQTELIQMYTNENRS